MYVLFKNNMYYNNDYNIIIKITCIIMILYCDKIVLINFSSYYIYIYYDKIKELY